MRAIDYRRFGTRQLDELFERSKRSEQDLERPLAARLDLAELPNAHRTSNSDPVAKRLGFLLAKFRNQRRAVEQELAMRRRYSELALRNIDELESEKSCTEEPPVTDGNLFAATRHIVPAVVA